MTTVEIKEKIFDYIQKVRDGVSFVEIERLFSPTEIKGELAMEFKHNLIMWAGMNEKFCDAMRLLQKEKKVAVTPTTVFVYMVDGGMLKLPIAKSARDYKEPHWVPVVFGLAK